MPLTVPVLETWQWPWSIWTLHVAYLASGLVIAAHYLPLLRRAWRFLAAGALAHSLLIWSVWTLCLAIAFTSGMFQPHDLAFMVAVGADVSGRLVVAALIVRARRIGDVLAL